MTMKHNPVTIKYGINQSVSGTACTYGYANHWAVKSTEKYRLWVPYNTTVHKVALCKAPV